MNHLFKDRIAFGLIVIAVGVALFVPTIARGADKKGPKPASSSKVKVVYEKKTTLDFEQKSVDSQFLSPDGAAVKGDQNLEFESLLAPRNDFSKELNRGARAVR